jgi:hypothetical protein
MTHRLAARPHALSVAALALGALAAILDAFLLIAPQEDRSSLVWPLIVLPAVIVPAPVLVPQRSVRVAGAAALAAWCVLTTFSLGPLFIPCLLLMLAAAAARP